MNHIMKHIYRISFLAFSLLCGALLFTACDTVTDYIDSYTDSSDSSDVTEYSIEDLYGLSYTGAMTSTGPWLTIKIYEENGENLVDLYVTKPSIDLVFTATGCSATVTKTGKNRYSIVTEGGSPSTWNDTLIVGIRSIDELVMVSSAMGSSKATLYKD